MQISASIRLLTFIDLVDCKLSPIDWSITECSATCGEGIKTLKRKILQPALNGGKDCDGNLTITQKCDMEVCPGIDVIFAMRSYTIIS